MTRVLSRAAATMRASTKPKRKSPYVSGEFRALAEKRQDALIARLQRTYKQSGIALYLGAGVSASVGFPAWGQLIRNLMSHVFEGKAYGGLELAYEKTDSWPWSPAAFHDAVDAVRLDTSRPLIMLARMLRGHLKRELPERIAGALYFNSVLGEWLVDEEWVKQLARGEATLDLDLMSSALINAIAEISTPRPGSAGVKAIINYNFDDLVDEVIRQNGTLCTTISGPGDRVTAKALPSYHVHGVLPLRSYAQSIGRRRRWKRPRGDFVFSEEEYHRQYAEPFRWSNLIQTSLLGAHDGLFIGLSLEDPNIRRLLDATHRQYPRRRNYAVLKRTRPLRKAGRGVKEIVVNLFEDIESESFADIGVHVIWVDEFKDIPIILKGIAGVPDR